MKLTQEVQEILNLIDGEMEKISEMKDILKDAQNSSEYIQLTGEDEVLKFIRMSIVNKIIQGTKKDFAVSENLVTL